MNGPLPLLTVLLGACAPKPSPLDALAEQERTGAPVVLVVRGASASFDEVMTSVAYEIDGEIDLLSLPIEGLTVPLLSSAVSQTSPQALLLIDNPAVDLYQQLREQNPETPPGVAVMSLFLEEAAATTPGLTGIPYEVPAVTSLVNLRRVVDRGFTKVGVVHRPRFAEFVERQAELAKVEGFEVVSFELKERPQAQQIRKALSRVRDEADALWVLNDNALLAPELLQEAWLPHLRRNTSPVLVGVEPLVDTPTPFGTFAVLPDHDGLGLQTAEILFELLDCDWEVAEVPIQLPIAVTNVLNVSFAREHLGVREDQLEYVDRLVE